jgi:hypothetical protein
VVALLAAQRRPDLAARLVLIGQSLNSAGRVAGGLPDAILGSDPERPELVSQLLLTFLRDGFPAGPAPAAQ